MLTSPIPKEQNLSTECLNGHLGTHKVPNPNNQCLRAQNVTRRVISLKRPKSINQELKPLQHPRRSKKQKKNIKTSTEGSQPPPGVRNPKNPQPRAHSVPRGPKT